MKYKITTTKNVYEIEANSKKEAENIVRTKIKDATNEANIYVQANETAQVLKEIAELVSSGKQELDKNYIKNRAKILKTEIDKLFRLIDKY